MYPDTKRVSAATHQRRVRGGARPLIDLYGGGVAKHHLMSLVDLVRNDPGCGASPRVRGYSTLRVLDVEDAAPEEPPPKRRQTGCRIRCAAVIDVRSVETKTTSVYFPNHGRANRDRECFDALKSCETPCPTFGRMVTLGLHLAERDLGGMMMSNVYSQPTAINELDRSTARRRLGRAAALAAASSGLLMGLSVPANAAEITPVAQYVDHTVSSTESELGGAVAALGIHP